MKSCKAFTLVEILVIVVIISLLATLAIPNLLRARVNSHESAAQASLKLISNSLENYSALNSVYPNSTSLLLGASPPYLNIDFFNGTHSGYTFGSNITDYSYSITAYPVSSGTRTFTISTGGVLQSL